MSGTILVTGATGFLGRHVVRRLTATGARVVAVSHHGGDVEGVRVESIDLRDRSSAMQQLEPLRWDTVVHLAAQIPTTYDTTTMRSSFESTLAVDETVVSLCRASGSRLVYASTAAVYGSSGRIGPCREDQPPTPASPYADAKLIGEIVAMQLARDHGLPVATLRISAPYGPGQVHRTVIGIFLRAALESRPIIVQGSGARTQDFIFVDDVVAAIDAALAADVTGLFNVGTGTSVSMRDLAETVLRAVPCSGSTIEMSGGEDSQEDHRVAIDVSKAREQLDWRARWSLLDGLRASASALRPAT